jgi:hypothetical protein
MNICYLLATLFGTVEIAVNKIKGGGNPLASQNLHSNGEESGNI